MELPDAVRAAVVTAARPLLAPFGRTARAVAETNLHVTVRFLGEVGDERLPALRAALRGATAAIRQRPPSSATSSTASAAAESAGVGATIRVTGFGAFPNLRAPRVVWAGIDDPERSVSELERAVTAAVAPLGFEPEDRRYTPHVTVARIDDARRGRGRREHAPAAFVPPPPSQLGPAFVLSQLTLFASELTPSGTRYRAIDRFRIAGGP